MHAAAKRTINHTGCLGQYQQLSHSENFNEIWSTSAQNELRRGNPMSYNLGLDMTATQNKSVNKY